MDPSKFSVRVKNPTMIRQERFSDASYSSNLPVEMNDHKSRYEKYETNFGSWCAPRKVHSTSTSSSGNETDRELQVKKSSRNVKNLRKQRLMEHARRIEELSRPRMIVNQVQRFRENQSKSSTRQEIKPEIKTSSQTDFVTIEPAVITEKPILRHRRPTDRIAKLAEPKIRKTIPPNPLGKVEERALLAVASKRITELAEPKCSPIKISSTEKPNPYSVSPRALKATCSPIIESLARPKKFISLLSNSKIRR